MVQLHYFIIAIYVRLNPECGILYSQEFTMEKCKFQHLYTLLHAYIATYCVCAHMCACVHVCVRVCS